MEFLIILLIMLAAVLLADILAHFIPAIPSPIMQIALGAAISFIPVAHGFHLGHEYFHILFVAPLLYYGGMEINRKELWKMKGSIANMSILLVIGSGVIVAFALHSLIPVISVMASVTLMAALGPTDHIAVDTVEKHSNIPHSLMELLKNESVFAEVTAVIFLETCLAVLAGEHITAGETITSFLRLFIGGIIVGAVLAIIKLLIVKFLYAQGIKQTPLHTMIGVVFPIFAYIIAEHFHVSGAVAIFLAGIISTYEYNKERNDAIRLDVGAEHVWEFITFTLEGLIFVMLGMQMPELLEELFAGHLEVSTGWAIAVILIISGIILAIRFFWGLATLPKTVYKDVNIKKSKAALLFSMSGARGAITWAAISSIPAVLANGLEFPHRELITVISMGVIIVSIVVAYIVLPLIAPMHASKLSDNQIKDIRRNIFTSVADNLEKLSTSKNQKEVDIVAFSYRDVADDIAMSIKNDSETNSELDALSRKILDWKIENVERLEAEEKISAETANKYISIFGRRKRNKIARSVTSNSIHAFFYKKKLRDLYKNRANNVNDDEYIKISQSGNYYVLEKLEELKKTDDSSAVEQAINKYRFNIASHNYNTRQEDIDSVDPIILSEVQSTAMELEKQAIQDAYENGDITYSEAKNLKNALAYKEFSESE